MNKILTIIIPTYNMEKYLRRCLDSLIIDEEGMKQLEVLVINDGSKDSSSQIAHEYQDKYPDTFRVIDKENGNYGSCINRGLKEATGKYFRMVDADDWVDSDGLFMILNELNKIDDDIIFTKYAKVFSTGKEKVYCDLSNVQFNYTYNLYKEIIPSNCLAMHGMTIKTDFLKSVNYEQTEGISYTDSEFVLYPLSQAKTLRCYDIELYQYFLGRNEQTMSKSSLVKNFKSFDKLYNIFLKFKPQKTNVNYPILINIYIHRMLTYMLDILIIYGGYSIERDNLLRTYVSSLENSNNNAFIMVMSNSQYHLPYVKIWYKFRLLSKGMMKIIQIFKDKC